MKNTVTISTRHASAYSAIILACLFLVLCSSSIQAQPPSPVKPAQAHEDTNVILISLQCLRPDHLGTYGYTRNTSRNIDALAKESVLFENAISQANLTPVAQMSVFTSQYPRINGMISFEVTKDMVTSTTLPQILKNYGYTTAAAVSSPEFFMRYDTKEKTMVNPGDVYSRSFDSFSHTRSGLGGQSVRKAPTQALTWLRKNKDKKFFLWVASGMIHMPYGAAVPAPFYSMYDPENYTPFWKRLSHLNWKDKKKGSPSYDVFSRVYRQTFYWDFAPIYKLTKDDVAYVNARYDAGVYYTDRFIGELMKLLNSLELSEKTMVVLHSIHGEDLGEQGDFFHYDVTDTIIKNALIMRFPNHQYANTRIKEQVQSIDVLPTILDQLDIPLPHQAEGGSLLPLIKGDVSISPSEFAYIDRMPWWEYTLSKWYLEFQKDDQEANYTPKEKEKIPAYLSMLKKNFNELGYPPGDIAIRTNQWKLIVRKNVDLLNKVSWWSFISGEKHDYEELELFDLHNDPQETTNVAQNNPDVVARLQKKLLEWDKSVELRKAQFKTGDDRLLIPYPGEQ